MLKTSLVLLSVLFAVAGAHARPVNYAAELETGMEPFLARTQLIFRLLGDFWGTEMRGRGVPFRAPKLNFYSDQMETACGPITKMMGPLYCSVSQTIYLEGSWFFDHSRLTGVSPEFSVVFILAHEYAHHITEITGFYRKLLDVDLPEEDHALTSRMNELMMDGWAGIFIGHLFKYKALEEQALKEIERYVFACGNPVRRVCLHGTGMERLGWFRKGNRSRRIEEINPYLENNLFLQATGATKSWITEVLFAPKVSGK